MIFAVKNKERPMLIRFEEGKTIKDKIRSRSRQKKNAQPDARTSAGNSCNIQHHSTLVFTFLMQLLLETSWPENHQPIYIPPF